INELPYKEELVFIQPTKNNPTMNMRVEKIFWYKNRRSGCRDAAGGTAGAAIVVHTDDKAG
ncbi:hypothetical protein MJN19_23685, partial [Salmonella enterica subsp. enterica serovar Montevideo]|nr:hypothetical protein [Salmonella enterica subsp. enterica serovar Montevideo]